MIPTTKLVKIHTTQMIAVSIQMYATDANSAGMSRRGRDDFWDDEEDYEFINTLTRMAALQPRVPPFLFFMHSFLCNNQRSS